MTIEKHIKSEAARRKFRAAYANGDVDTEVLMNLCSVMYEPNNQEYQKFYKILMVNPAISLHYGEDAIKERLGELDFTFNGNRLYKNWVVESHGLIFIGPSKWEVVIPEELKNKKTYPKDFFEKVIGFHKDWIEVVINHLVANPDKVGDYFKSDFKKFVKKYVVQKNGAAGVDWSRLKVPSVLERGVFLAKGCKF